ncbi:MAG: hypothetical protein K2H09_01635, partial [Treponemataceae bacterium]|nr:hypothetical protein [Treponemataceae bacterium]
FGADIRYAVCEGGVILPKISLGAGYAFTKRSMEYARTEAVSLNGESGAVGFGITTAMQQHTISAQLQVSKKIFIFTPFVGAKALLSFGESDFSWRYAITRDGEEAASAEDSDSFSYKRGASFSNVTPQVFAGLGVTVGFFQIGLSAAWNPISNYWSAAAATRFRM